MTMELILALSATGFSLCLLVLLRMLQISRGIVYYARPIVDTVAATELPKHAIKPLDQACSDLNAAGLRPSGYLRSEYRSGEVAYSVLYLDGEQHCRVQATVTLRRSGKREGRRLAVEVEAVTELESRRDVITVHASTYPRLDACRGQAFLYLPRAPDVRALLATHHSRIEAVDDEEPIPTTEPDAKAREAKRIRTWIDAHARRGSLEYNDDRYHLTARGAWRHFFRSTWPFSAVARWRTCRKGRRVMTSLELQREAIRKVRPQGNKPLPRSPMPTQ